MTLVTIFLIIIGVIGLITILFAIKEKSLAAAFGGVLTLLLFVFGLIWGNQLIINPQPPAYNTPLYVSYTETARILTITARACFAAETVEVTYSRPQDDTGRLSLNKTGERTWIGSLDKNEIRWGEDNLSVRAVIDDLSIYHVLQLDGETTSLPAEADIAAFTPKVDLAEQKNGDFVQLTYKSNVYMKSAEGGYFDADNKLVKFGLISEDGYSWKSEQAIDTKNVKHYTLASFVDDKQTQYIKTH
ncbi:hypothetical protein FACS189492_1840 [Clostridia bacterium]|nr:hypothetical protein FACS189492_1840 [Clostridia bacterium]